MLIIIHLSYYHLISEVKILGQHRIEIQEINGEDFFRLDWQKKNKEKTENVWLKPF